jgi:hypothetical protein
VRGGQLEGKTVLSGGDEPGELVVHLGELAGTTLLRDEADEVPDELVGTRADLVEHRRFACGLDLRVAEKRAQLGKGVECGGERGEVGRDGLQAIFVPCRLEERTGVHPLRDRHA